MDEAIVTALLNNAATLLVLSIILDITNQFFRKSQRVKEMIRGILISLICFAIMRMPFVIQTGIVFDTRSILISVTGLIFGVIPTVITVLTAIIIRISMGGSGALPGVAVILSSAMIGLAWRYWVFPKVRKWRWLSVLVMGILVHIVMIGLMFLLPYPSNVTVVKAITEPVLLIYPIATVLLSMLLLKQEKYFHLQIQLQQSEERFRGLFDKAPLGYQSLDANGHFIEVNQQWLDTLGYPRDEVVGKWFGDFLCPESRSMFRKRFELFKAQGYIHSEFQMVHKDGEQKSVAFDGRIGYGDHGEFKQTHCILQDVTQQRINEENLRLSEAKYSYYIENAPYAVFVVHSDRHFVEVNRAFSLITGYDKEQLLRMSIDDITADHSKGIAKSCFDTLIKTGRMNAEMTYIHRDGSIRWWTVSAVKVFEEVYISFASDITDRKTAEQKLLYLSYHDFLTGVYNRTFFEEQLERINTPDNLPLSLMMTDINGVKLVNDAFGHAEGDKLIISCASILQSCCRATDTLARLGGDEFGILMPNTDAQTALSVMQSIQNKLHIFDAKTKGEKFLHSMALGFATKVAVDEDMGQILKTAEDYMYQRKLLEHTSSHSAIVSSIKATMLEKSHETEEHAERLVELTREIVRALDLPQVDQDRMALLATLHDIGKVGVSDQILTKPGKLDEDEWTEMRRHPEIGYRIAVSSPDLIPIAEGILCHHERWDGKGYPRGLRGSNIPLLARVLSVVDAYDAMTQDRPYQKAISHEAAVAELTANAGTQFDPDVVAMFLQNLQHNKADKANN